MATRAPALLRPKVVVPVVVGVVVLVVVVVVFANLYTDLLFYRQVGYARVFDTVLATKVVMFLVFGTVLAVVVGANITVAYRLRPSFRPLTAEQESLDRWRAVVDPLRIPALLLVSGFVGLLAGLAYAHRWRTVQLWLHGQPFGVTDPQFHRDISYYVFTYPFERMVLGFGFAAVLVALLATLGTYYLYGAVRLQARTDRVSAAARAHVSVLLGVFVLLKAVAYYLDRFGLDFSPRGRVTGAGYADVHATLPAKTILLVVALICAALFFANVPRRGFTLPGIALGLLVLSAIVIGGIYPAAVEQFSVKPNEINLEAPYIQRNIDATQRAFQIGPTTAGGRVRYTNYAGTTTPSAAAASEAASSVPTARLLDPLVMQPTFQQLQQNRAYYTFPNIAVDRYTVNGVRQPYLVAVRDVNLGGLRPDQQNWLNEHLIYTHGIGFVAAPVDTVDSQGRPVFTDGNIPTTGPGGGPPGIPVSQPRIYYGLNSPEYSIVHTTQQEIDGPEQANYTYSGSGGVSIGSGWRRLLFAIRYRERNILLSNALTPQSRIMYYRDPITRVHKVAPWLTLDGDPYPAVVGGRIVWIVDGYTTTDMYPYSERVNLASATADTRTAAGAAIPAPGETVSYMRNSVKAVVDAFNGSVSLYAFDPRDPILRTWEKVFPATVKPMSAMPADLVAHLRYPEDIFDVQRSLLTRYHVSDARAFFRGNDFWSLPADPANNDNTTQPPYYQYLQVPGQSQPSFDLTTTLVAANRPNLAAFVSVSSSPQDYGTMRVLQLPVGTSIQGPSNVSNLIESDPTVSSALTLLRQGGSRTIQGNLLPIPVDGGLLFIEPIYVEAQGGSQNFPTLQKVAVLYGGSIGFGPDLSSALSQVFGSAPPGTQGSGSSPPPTSSSGKAASAEVSALIRQAQADYAAAQAALRAGDFAAYGSDTAQLGRDLSQLASATSGSSTSKRSSGASPSSSPAARSSPSPTSSRSP